MEQLGLGSERIFDSGVADAGSQFRIESKAPVRDGDATGRSAPLISLLLAFVLLPLLWMTAPSALAQDKSAATAKPPSKTIIAVVPRSWPPQYDVDDDGKPVGFAIDIMNEIAALAGLSVKYRIVENFSVAGAILEKGDADLIPNSGILSERLDAFAFTAPVETFVVSVFVRSGSDHINDAEDLVGQKLAVVEKNIGFFMFGKRQDIKVQVYKDVRTALFDLIAGQVDALVFPRPVLLALARQAGVADRIKFVGAPLREVKRGIRVMKGNDRLLTTLNKAVVAFVGTPAYQEVYRKWYENPAPYWTAARVASGMATAIFLVLIVMAWWRYRSVTALNRELRNTISEREAAERDVEERQEQLNAIMDNAADSIITIDETGRIELFNRAAEIAFGYTLAEIRGENVKILIPLPHHDKHDEYLSGYVETGQARIIGIGARELDASRKDGTTFPIDLAVSEMFVGGRRHFIGIVRDISERKEQQGRLEQAQKMEAIGQLTGGVAHDFNNLLTVILGNLELLEERFEGDEVARDLTDAAVRATLRGADLTQRLLAFSRKQPLDPRATEINDLVPNAAELMRRTLGEDIEIETVFGVNLWSAMVDEGQLENSLLNLAINSRDAMPDGGKLTIETANVHLDREYAETHTEVTAGQYVMVAVSDTGIGIHPRDLKRVFEPFFTTKDVGKGTGLGLSMVFGFIKQSGGHVAVYSELGNGTTVRLYLPKATDADLGGRTSRPSRESMPAGNETILIVEDDPDVRAFLSTALDVLGYNIIEAEDGPASFSVMEETAEIDLLLTDVVLPRGINGREVALEARQRYPEIKVLFTSGYTENAIIHHGRLDDGVEILSKPYTRQTLSQRVRRTLDGE